MILAVLALWFAGQLEGRGVENPTLLPVLNFVTDADTMPPLEIISLRNDRTDFHQIIIPQTMPKGWGVPGTIIDHGITTQAYQNIFEMIVGRVPGVWVSGNQYNYQVRIRGALGPPLVVVNGMIFRSFDDYSLNNLLLSIPPADVDYIELLKSIAQTAIYGPGAGNGVIIVHT